MRTRDVGAAALATCVLLGGCLPAPSPDPSRAAEPRGTATHVLPPGTASSASPPLTAGYPLPPVSGQFDYQLAEPYPPPPGTVVLARDYREQPEPGLFNICYINALQTQPEQEQWWLRHHPDLLLRGPDGDLVRDEEWDELLFDVSTEEKRRALLAVQQQWIDTCAEKGFQAVEADAQDSYDRSRGRLDFEHDKEYLRLFVEHVHARGMSAVQKNAGVEYGDTGRTEIGFDFALAEECQHWDECDAYTDVYGQQVIEVEYTDQPRSAFTTACELRKGQHTILRRDRQLNAPGQPGYSYEVCP